jgi:hypothetical protein
MRVVKNYKGSLSQRVSWRIVTDGTVFNVEEREGEEWRTYEYFSTFATKSEAVAEVHKRDMISACNDLDGLEVPQCDWALFEKLVAEKRIASLGPARGPDAAWRRAEPRPEYRRNAPTGASAGYPTYRR